MGDCVEETSNPTPATSCCDFRPEAGDCQPRKLRYVQPERRKPIRPTAQYEKPGVTMEMGTIYKNSYPCFDAAEVANSRLPAARPTHQLQKPNGCFLVDTVTAVSYQPPCNVDRAKPIRPKERSMLGEGKMQDLTTQKHDFVGKPSAKRNKIPPCNNIQRSCGPFEQQTVQKISFDCPDYSKFEPATTCKPVVSYQQPTQPMEMRTTQKLSYTAVCPLPKEILPWALRPKYIKPEMRMECGTTYGHSFLANCKDYRSAKIIPTCNPQLLTTSRYFDANTIYKNSFLPGSGRRPDAIRPRAQLQLPDCYKQDGETVYKLSFPIHVGVHREAAIRPQYRSMLGKGPMQELTTQKHDFICKQGEKSHPIRPRDQIERTTCPFVGCTVNKISYQPNKENFVPSKSCRPILIYSKPTEPMEFKTVQKCSFQPVPLPRKEELPWAAKAKFQQPTSRMATETVQRLSFMPPGCFVDDGCATFEPACCFPRAGIV